MEVEVKLFNLLQQYSPCDQNAFSVRLPVGASLDELLKRLKIPPTAQRIALVNGRRAGDEALLSPGDTVVLMSPMEGG
jgi:molybdopterin converting factor small subunit